MSRPLKTIWIWPTANFPRRLMYYLKAKELPISHLYDDARNQEGDLQLLPMKLNKETWKIEPASADVEDRPSGCSIPAIRVRSSEGDYLVTQTSSILEYLEKVYPPSEGYPDLSGGSLQRRAKVRDIVSMLTETFQWIGVDIFHTNSLTLRFTGMGAGEQVAAAGEQGRRWWKSLMSKVEAWVSEESSGEDDLSIVGGPVHTLADFTLAAMTDYFREMYELDILQDFKRLKNWHENCSRSEWYISRQDLENMVDGGFDSLFRSEY